MTYITGYTRLTYSNSMKLDSMLDMMHADDAAAAQDRGHLFQDPSLYKRMQERWAGRGPAPGGESQGVPFSSRLNIINIHAHR